MDLLNCMHPLEKIRVVVTFDKVFERAHKVGKIRVFCIECNMDLPEDSKQSKIALSLAAANMPKQWRKTK